MLDLAGSGSYSHFPQILAIFRPLKPVSVPDLASEAARCVACGLCLPHCPTYRKTGSEADSPRGRIMLMQGMLEGRIPADARFHQHLDLCLTCRACESVCPNKVAYGHLIEGVRAQVDKARHRSLQQRLLRQGLPAVMTRPVLLRLASAALRLWQGMGAPVLLRRFGALRMASSLPPIRPQPMWQPVYPAHGKARGAVGLFLGCVARAMDNETLAATIFVLNRLGYTVHVPAAQGCCGALHASQGELIRAQTFSQRNLEAFKGLALDAVISTATGCGMALKEYPPEFAGKVRDVSEFLASVAWDDIKIAPLSGVVAVHEPCSMRNVLHCEGAPYALLRAIPGLTLRPLTGNDQCCGAAGSYFMTQPAMAGLLLDDKIEAVKVSGASYLVSSNIGCALHLAMGMRAADMEIEVLHPVTLLARQMGFDDEQAR